MPQSESSVLHWIVIALGGVSAAAVVAAVAYWLFAEVAGRRDGPSGGGRAAGRLDKREKPETDELHDGR